MRGNYATYLTACTSCGGNTSKAYARKNAGRCKACATGVETTTYRAKRSNGMCEDAPCCGCCGPQGDGDYYGYNGGDR